MLLHLIKWLFILALFAVVILTLYAYLGPMFGADFAPEQREIRQEIIIEDT